MSLALAPTTSNTTASTADAPEGWLVDPEPGLFCAVCGSPIWLTELGPIGLGVCRYDEDPNQDDQGMHVAVRGGLDASTATGHR